MIKTGNSCGPEPHNSRVPLNLECNLLKVDILNLVWSCTVYNQYFVFLKYDKINIKNCYWRNMFLYIYIRHQIGLHFCSCIWRGFRMNDWPCTSLWLGLAFTINAHIFIYKVRLIYYFKNALSNQNHHMNTIKLLKNSEIAKWAITEIFWQLLSQQGITPAKRNAPSLALKWKMELGEKKKLRIMVNGLCWS